MEFKGVMISLPAQWEGGAERTPPAHKFPPSPRGGQFPSKWVRAKRSTIPQKETSDFDSSEPSRAKPRLGAFLARRRARFSDGGGNAIRMHLRSILGFVPIFWTNALICGKSSVAAKKSACLVSKIHSCRGSTQFFLPRSKSFFCSESAARERMISSFRARYIGFGISPSRYAETSFSMRSSLALI